MKDKRDGAGDNAGNIVMGFSNKEGEQGRREKNQV